MPRRGPLLVAAVTGAGVIGLVLVVGARVPSAAIVAAAERALGYPFTVERVQLRFVPQPAVELLNVEVPDAGLIAGCAAAFESDRVRLRLALLPLMTGRAVVERIDVDAPLVRLVRPAADPVPEAAATRSPTRGTRPSSPGKGHARPSTDQEKPAPANGTAPIFRLRGMRIRDGRVQFLDEATSTRWAVGQVQASAMLDAAAERAQLEVRGTLRRQGRELLAGVAVDGTLRWGARRPRLRGRMTTGPFAYGPLSVDAAEARLQVDAGGIHLRDLSFRLGEGAVAGRARLRVGPVPTMALSLAGHGQALERAFDEAKVVVRGGWEVRLRLRGPVSRQGMARRLLRGRGRVAIRSGSIEPFELGSGLLDVVAPLRGRAQTQRLRTRYDELFAERSLRFEQLSGTCRIAGGRVRTHDLLLRGEDYRARGTGTIGMDGTLSLGVRLTLSTQLTEDLVGRGGLAVVSGASPGVDPTIPLRLDGTVEHPRIRATSAWSRAVIRRTFGGGGMGDLLERLLR
jgi:uncharacterized protein involved in outer membrane biogenesis